MTEEFTVLFDLPEVSANAEIVDELSGNFEFVSSPVFNSTSELFEISVTDFFVSSFTKINFVLSESGNVVS